MKIIKWGLLSVVGLLLIVTFAIYMLLKASLPSLDASIKTPHVKSNASLSRDTLGNAIINAQSQLDAVYLLGFAHAQDRLFQMDLLRRQSAGELSQLVGKRALSVDKKHRFHQFRKRATHAFNALPEPQKIILEQYTKGVNDGAESLGTKPFEYYLTGSAFTPWQPADSLLASYSMYIDLQLSQTEQDFRLNALYELFDEQMYTFFTLPSEYQAAIDGTRIAVDEVIIPKLDIKDSPKPSVQAQRWQVLDANSEQELADIGSNNWAVAGTLTNGKSALLANDMHLGLRVPAIWYRAQLNYPHPNSNKINTVKVTGVTLPGTPGIIVGSNGHISWGFTNSNIDNADWIKLNDNTATTTIKEIISTPEGDEEFEIEMSEFGPVRHFNSNKYALKWVAHQPYAVNMKVIEMAHMHNVDEGLALSKTIRIPVQNMVIADANGDVAWQLTGAISGRTSITRRAISESQYSALWANNESSPANHIRPANGRVFSANARVVGSTDLLRFGDGGYALGARQQQIVDGLHAQDMFTEQDFYKLQLDNRALFLKPWHALLLNQLQNSPQAQVFSQDIDYLKNWQACACSDSVGYTLVRRFRSAVISNLLTPVNNALKQHDMSTSHILRAIEPAVWAIIEQQPAHWLNEKYTSYDEFLVDTYRTTKIRLFERYSPQADTTTSTIDESHWLDLAWGNVNRLSVNHPFAAGLGVFADMLNMPSVEGFGDSYMPAVQGTGFGASQRLIVRPGNEQDAILTVPGGQSGHFLSKYYRKGFGEYATHANTPLLPSGAIHKIEFMPL